MMTQRKTKDSGRRTQFNTGAQRDIEGGKQSTAHLTLTNWNNFMFSHNQPELKVETDGVADTGFDDSVKVSKVYNPDHVCVGVCFYKRNNEGDKWIPAEMLIDTIFLNRLQALMQRGADKYDSWNWLKGMPLIRFFTSCVRHLFQWRWGDVTEDHLAGAAFNLMGAMGIEHRVEIGWLSEDLIDGVGVIK